MTHAEVRKEARGVPLFGAAVTGIRMVWPWKAWENGEKTLADLGCSERSGICSSVLATVIV